MRDISDEIPFEIPDSWEWVRLGAISTYAQTKEKINAQSANKDMWGLNLEDIEKGGRLLGKKKVGERKAIGDKTVFSKGDILYSKLRPYLQKILIADEDGICTPEIVPFNLYGIINPQYIIYYLQSPFVDTYINSITYGIKMPRVGTETMTNLIVPLPPIEEQSRIVTKIEEIIPHLLDYNASEFALAQLNSSFPEALKKSILQMAVQGKLVPQDPNDEPASVLLERIRAEKHRLVKEGKIKKDKHDSFIYRRDNSHYEKSDGIERCIDDEIPFDIPESWEWVRLKTLFNIVSARRVHQSDWRKEGVPFYRAREIGKLSENGVVNNELFINEELYDKLSKSGIPSANDIMMTAVGTLGKTYVVKPTDRFYYKDASVICLENFSNTSPFYIKLAMQSPYMCEQIKECSSGTTVGTVTIVKASDYLIPLPPSCEQKRIVDAYRGIIEFTNKLG